MQSQSQLNTSKELVGIIDWISVTVHPEKSDREKYMGYVHNFFMDDKWTDTKAHNGYSLAWVNDYGIKQMVHPYRADMGTHIIYSGKTIRKIEGNTRITAMDILNYHITHKDNLVRVDVSIDAHNYGLDILKLADDFYQKKVKTRAKKALLLNEVGGNSHTLYIGSKSKRKKLLRVYDKAQEMGVLGDWKRIELQVMGEKPIAEMVKILSENKGNEVKAIQGIIRGYCDFENETWKEIMQSDAIKLSSVTVEKGNTKSWLLNQCVPALVKECRIDAQFWEQFMLACISQMNEEN